MADKPNGSSTQRIVLSREPLMAGVPLRSLDGATTAVEQFFVRNHFQIPIMDGKPWSRATF